TSRSRGSGRRDGLPDRTKRLEWKGRKKWSSRWNRCLTSRAPYKLEVDRKTILNMSGAQPVDGLKSTVNTVIVPSPDLKVHACYARQCVNERQAQAFLSMVFGDQRLLLTHDPTPRIS